MFKTIINLRVIDKKPITQEELQTIEEELNGLFISTKGKIIMFKRMNIEEAADEALLHDLDPEYLNIRINSDGSIQDLGFSIKH